MSKIQTKAIHVLSKSLLCLALLASNAFAQSDAIESFYVAPKTVAVVKNLVVDYNVDNSFNTDDSKKLQKAINEISKQKGGILTIPKGNYTFSEIEMRNNVHLEIESGTIIRPLKKGLIRKKNKYVSHVVFYFNSKEETRLKNVSIKGIGGRFTIDFTDLDNTLVRAFNFRNVDNFYLANVDIQDKYTKFAGIVLNGEELPKYVYGPKNGVIENVDIYNADYGYGLVQIQIATNVLFKNIGGLGGATLRLEPHVKNLRDQSRVDNIDKVVGRNIVNKYGNSAIMLSPHFVNNGVVDIKGVTGIGSGIAVRIESGFTTKEEAALGLKPGSFDSRSSITDIKASYTADKAQVKPKHFKYMPCDLQKLVSKTPIKPKGKSYFGPSIMAVSYDANFTINVSEKDIIKATGFQESQIFVTKKLKQKCN